MQKDFLFWAAFDRNDSCIVFFNWMTFTSYSDDASLESLLNE